MFVFNEYLVHSMIILFLLHQIEAFRKCEVDAIITTLKGKNLTIFSHNNLPIIVSKSYADHKAELVIREPGGVSITTRRVSRTRICSYPDRVLCDSIYVHSVNST